MKKTILYFLIIVFLYSCSCPPASQITNGRALDRWERKHRWGKRTVRVMWINKTGPYYKIRFENMKERFNRLFKTLPAWCKEGTWVSIDSVNCYAL